MKKELLKKVLTGAGILFGLLVVVLCVHIYIVTRPKPMSAEMRIMARVDFKQDLNTDDAAKITTFLYQQKGIDHVLCNPAGKLVVFTFYPAKTSAKQKPVGKRLPCGSNFFYLQGIQNF